MADGAPPREAVRAVDGVRWASDWVVMVRDVGPHAPVAAHRTSKWMVPPPPARSIRWILRAEAIPAEEPVKVDAALEPMVRAGDRWGRVQAAQGWALVVLADDEPICVIMGIGSSGGLYDVPSTIFVGPLGVVDV